MSENNSSAATNNFGFWTVFKTAFAGTFSRLGRFLFYGVVLGVFSLGLNFLNTFMLPKLFGLHVVFIILIYLTYLVFSFFVGVFSNLIYKSIAKSYFHSSKVSFFSHVSYSFSNLIKAAGVSIRALWYVGKWFLVPTIIVLILFVVLSLAPTSSMFSAVSFVESSEPSVSSADGPFRSLVSGGIMMLGNVIMLIGGVIALIRFPKVMFAMTAFVEDGVSGKKALEFSKRITKGRWWKVFGYMFLFLLIFMLAFYAIFFLASFVAYAVIMSLDYFMLSILAGLILVLLGIILSSISSVFVYKFYLELKKTSK